MSLKTLLAENPGAQAEYDAAIKSAHETGADEVAVATKARTDAAAPFMAADSKYPPSITALAVQVATGKADMVALTAAVAAVDAVTEVTASTEAGNESEEQGDTSAQEHAQANDKGVAENNEDYNAQVSAARKSRGLEA